MPCVFKIIPKAIAKGVWDHPRSSQPVRDWHTDYIGHLPLSKHFKHALVCVDIASGLTQAFPCCHANQATTIKGLKKLSTMCGYPHRSDSDQGSHVKGHDMQDWTEDHDIKWRFHLPYNPQAAGLIER